MLDKNKYDVIFLDIQMPNMTGFEAARQIRLKDSRTRIIILSMQCDEKSILDANDTAINGYLLKDTDLNELKRCLENVMEGIQYFTGAAMEILLKALIKKDKIASVLSRNTPGNEITSREKDVLKMICSQHSSQEIAEKLFVSVNTVKTHRNQLLEKTESKNAVGLVIYAIRNGIFRIS